MPAGLPTPACCLLFCILVSGSTHFQTESLQSNEEKEKDRRWNEESSVILNLNKQANISIRNIKHGHTWPPEQDELKVVFEPPGVEHTVAKYRKAESHRKERFVHHGNLVVVHD